MPRKSPYPIELSAKEAAELKRRAARYTLPYFEVVRARMILMAALGIDNDEIAARLDTRREGLRENRGFMRVAARSLSARTPDPANQLILFDF